MNAASSKISHVTPPTPREASGPEDLATTLHPFFSLSSFELHTSKITFLFGGGSVISKPRSVNSSPHIQRGNCIRKSLIFVSICCAKSRVFPITSTVCGDSGSARHISQPINAPQVVVIPACRGFSVATLLAFPRARQRSFCLGKRIYWTSFFCVASYVLRKCSIMYMRVLSITHFTYSLRR